jgi:hypothetical protein
MQDTAQMTLGQFLNQAERTLQTKGGFSAIADCTARIVTLHHTDATGTCTLLSSAQMPQGVAPEDIASDLLAEHASSAACISAQQAKFAQATFFPISIR